MTLRIVNSVTNGKKQNNLTAAQMLLGLGASGVTWPSCPRQDKPEPPGDRQVKGGVKRKHMRRDTQAADLGRLPKSRPGAITVEPVVRVTPRKRSGKATFLKPSSSKVRWGGKGGLPQVANA